MTDLYDKIKEDLPSRLEWAEKRGSDLSFRVSVFNCPELPECTEKRGCGNGSLCCLTQTNCVR